MVQSFLPPLVIFSPLLLLLHLQEHELQQQSVPQTQISYCQTCALQDFASVLQLFSAWGAKSRFSSQHKHV